MLLIETHDYSSLHIFNSSFLYLLIIYFIRVFFSDFSHLLLSFLFKVLCIFVSGVELLVRLVLHPFGFFKLQSPFPVSLKSPKDFEANL